MIILLYFWLSLIQVKHRKRLFFLSFYTFIARLITLIELTSCNTAEKITCRQALIEVSKYLCAYNLSVRWLLFSHINYVDVITRVNCVFAVQKRLIEKYPC